MQRAEACRRAHPGRGRGGVPQARRPAPAPSLVLDGLQDVDAGRAPRRQDGGDHAHQPPTMRNTTSWPPGMANVMPGARELVVTIQANSDADHDAHAAADDDW